jgi:type II secretory pathway pseudopilin PulG
MSGLVSSFQSGVGRRGFDRDCRRGLYRLGGRCGFTILEIMIATAILTLGLVSVLALFPAAIHTGKQVMDLSSSVVVAESVAEAIRESLRNQIRSIERSNGTNRYFVFSHDGVLDVPPNDRKQERPNKDYFILLPRFPAGRGFSGRNDKGRRSQAFKAGKVFVYPETDPNMNGGQGDARLADNDGDDYRGQFSNGRLYNDIHISKTYKLGQTLPGLDDVGVKVLEDQQIETLKQYSFAFAVRVSFKDSNGSLNDSQFAPSNHLYNFHVLIFRNFLPPAPDERHQEPVFEASFEVAI